MRRRYVRYVPPESDRPTVLLMAAGAIAGAAAGLYLGRRYATIGALLDDVKETVRDLRDEWTAAIEEEELEAGAVLEEGDEDVEDEDLEDEDADDEDDDDEGAVSEVDDWDDTEEDELEDLDDDLASVVAGNGHATPQEAAARRLEARVLDALHDDRRLRARAIEIAVVGDGVVELTGAVHAIEEISRAAAVVRRVPGVAMVLNRIEVRSAGHVDTASVPREASEPSPSDEESSRTPD